MPFIESVNSKANVKQFTSNDLPFSPSQPVINSYYATSTAGQTSIVNLGFTVNTSSTGFTDSFFLFVDGKKLTLGSSNDYVFAAVAADGSSSSVTLNQSLAAGLNIQAYKLGLKPEIQFGMDNRFTQLYAAEGAGFQGFVSQTDFAITPTSSTGTPPAGQFYSTIVGRAGMPDLSQDLKPRFGIERVMIQQQLQQIQNEFGPNGEQVWSVSNDLFGQIRFVGRWILNNSVYGLDLSTFSTADYLEITFYGTGLNILVTDGGGARDLRYIVDGGAEVQFSTITSSTVLGARNYSSNTLVPVVSGLTLGIHTVSVRDNGNFSNLGYTGFEILNQNAVVSNVTVNSGVGYIQSQKLVSSAQSLFSYSAPVTGTTGGRVLVYQKADGTVGTAFTQNATSSSTLTSTSHANEEMVRQYNWREFGAGRTDDLSSVGAAASGDVAFTLDDGITTLMGTNLVDGFSLSASQIGELQISGNNFFAFTFIGTGVDLIMGGGGGAAADNHTITLDGTVLTTTFNGVQNKIYKVASGLPYGTHVLKINRTVTAVSTVSFFGFRVYQPKKPALPSGAIELADYNVMATYSPTNTAAFATVSSGVMRKMGIREMTYVNTWGVSVNTAAQFWDSGFNLLSATNGAFVSYTFFGTGIELSSFTQASQAHNFTVSIDGSSNLSGFTTNFIQTGVTGLTFTASTGVIAGTSSGSQGRYRLQISNLSLGLHTVKVLVNATTDSYYADTFDVICPVHSTKSNLYADLQNTLTVGSNSISDNRQITPVKNALPATKAWAQAIGITANPTTNVSSLSPVPDMSVTVKTQGGALRISYNIGAYITTATSIGSFQVYVDGVAVGTFQETSSNTSTAVLPIITSATMRVPVIAGTHKVDLYWAINVATRVLTASGIDRMLLVEEV